jgi:hypothetical protein
MTKRKSKASRNTIPVFVDRPPAGREFLLEEDVTSRALDELDVDGITQQVRSIVSKLGDLAAGTPAQQSGYRLSEFSVALGVQAGGQVGLLGIGVNLQGTATFTLTFSST